METLLRVGLSNAVAALLMALAVVVAARLWRRPAVLHALWLLVLLKLVTPPLVWVSVPWPIIPEAPPVASAPALDAAPDEPLPELDATLVSDSGGTTETSVVETSERPGEGGRVSAPSSIQSLEPSRGAFATPLPWVCGAWLTGALAWYVLALVRLRRFRRLLRHAILAPEALRRRTQRLAEKLQLRRCPAVWLVPGRVAPMLWAAGGRPRILFPADLLKQVSAEQQDALLVHELAHLRRRDHWVRWLEFIAAGLYWWNPVLWFARRELREAEEQCCDAWVTAVLPGAGKTYATALLETLDFLSDAPPAAPLLASGVGRVVDLKRRLTMIMRGTTPRTLGWRGGAAVIGLGALLLPMLPAWVQAQAPAKTEAKDVQVSGDVKIFAPDVSPADLEKARAELKMLEATLEQRKAEVAEAAARVEAARARVRRDEAATKPSDGEGALKGRRIIVETDGAANPGQIQDWVKKLQEAMPGSGADVMVLDAATGRIILKAGAGLSPAAAASETDKRIIELEMKLKSLLSEVEKLRQERKPEPPKSTDAESKPHSYGPAPMEKIPYIDQLFKAVGPAQLQRERAALQAMKAEAEVQRAQAAMQEQLRAEAEKQKAQAAAERDASQARIKLLEEEIAKLKKAQGGNESSKP